VNKLGVIVPYRDRYDHLLDFKRKITEYLKFKGIDFELIVVEQDNAKVFNRGKLLNIGFKQAQKLKCNYVVFHDIDLLPKHVNYSFEEYPVQLASQRAHFDEYFGGVTLFPSEMFERINGYSNEYWGWGFEDDDLLYRCKANNIPLDKKEIKVVNNYTSAIKFNGYNTFIEGGDRINYDKLTIFIAFEPQDLILNHDKYDDEFVIFYLPKLNLRLSYDSYSKYKLVVENKKDLSHISSEKLPPYRTNLCVTIDRSKKAIAMYQDGTVIGTTTYTDELDNVEKSFYIGCDGSFEKYFKGLFHTLAFYNDILSEKDIKEISENKHFGLTQNFGNYKAANDLKLYYDTKFIKDYKLIDLAGTNRGIINYGEIVPCVFEDKKIVDIPFRKKSTFVEMSHEDNGFVGGSWKNITTRYNQLRFNNEVSKGYVDTSKEGLSSLYYKEFSNSTVDNYTHIVVGV
jgi:hypothetical protein